MSAVARMREYRQRQKAGRAVFAVEADPVAVAPVLMRMNLLAEHQADDHGAIAAAIGQMLDHLTEKERTS
jgi:hypothetical protein